MAVVEVAREASTEATGDLVTRSHFDTALALLEPDGQYVRFVVVDDNNVQMEVNLTLRDATKLAAGILNVVGVRLFCVGGPEGSRRGCERHGKSYLTRRRRGEEGDGGGSLTGGAIPSA